jgi:hypothetical protein
VWKTVLKNETLAQTELLGIGTLEVRYAPSITPTRWKSGNWHTGYGIPSVQYVVYLVEPGGARSVVATGDVSSGTEALWWSWGGGSEFAAIGLDQRFYDTFRTLMGDAGVYHNDCRNSR